MQMTRSSGEKMGIMKSSMKVMKKRQNMTKLRHKEWCDKSQTCIKLSLPKEPTMKIRGCLKVTQTLSPTSVSRVGLGSSQWLDNHRGDVTLKTSYHACVQEETGKHWRSSSRGTTNRVRSTHVRDSTGQSHLDPNEDPHSS